MDVNRRYIKVTINDEDSLVDLKWFRGASRYNNGCTRFGRKYLLRLVIGRARRYAVKTRRGGGF
jgi:hypothetical protein